MMQILLIIFGCWFAFVLLITVHEAGHFFVARYFSIKVRRVSLGFGKPLFKKISKTGIEYVVSVIPLGGYVKFVDTREASVPPEAMNTAFDRQKLYVRFLVIVAGALTNFLLAFILYWIVLSIGLPQIKPVIKQVISGSIAQQAQLKSDVEIKSINQENTPNWQSVIFKLFSLYRESDAMQLNGCRNQQCSDYHLDLRSWRLNNLQPDPLTSLGIVPLKPDANNSSLIYIEHYPFYVAWLHALQHTWSFLKFNCTIIKKLVTGKISLQALGGPLSIFQEIKLAALQGLIIYTTFIIFFSITLGIVNLLPIPGLDGGHLVIIFIEAIRGRPLSLAMQLLLYQLGLIVIFILMIQAITNDIMRMSFF